MRRIIDQNNGGGDGLRLVEQPFRLSTLLYTRFLGVVLDPTANNREEKHQEKTWFLDFSFYKNIK
ncbi:MAG: hypothetical protein LBE10_02085 [Treponema sp.]|jgi:hypothetical protein|nr:hypothetical protein [Treponema sp.]